MSLRVINRRKAQGSTVDRRLRRIREGARTGAERAAERMGPATVQARDTAADGLLVARKWSAPRLEQAAKYVETELGPRVGTLLSTTARQVAPPEPAAQRVGRNKKMIVLGTAAAAAAAGAALTRRGAAQRLTTGEDAQSTAWQQPVPNGRSHSG